MNARETSTAAPAPATHGDPRRRFYIRLNPRIFEALAPAAAFIVANRFLEIEFAIAASVLASIVIFARNPGRGTIRALGALGFAVVVGSAVLGLMLSSGKAVVAQNLFTDFLFAAIFAGSAVSGPPSGAVSIIDALTAISQVGHCCVASP